MSRKFRSKRINETRNYCLEEIGQNELMGRKHKMVCTTSNYKGYFLILVSAIIGCISIYSFASLLGITSSAIWVFPSKDLTYFV